MTGVGVDTMITCDAFIAEACTAASYGRRNFFGLNLGRRVLVPVFPYLLQAVFVVLIRAPANAPIEDLRLTLTSSWGATFTYHVGSLPSLDREQAHSIECPDSTSPCRQLARSRWRSPLMGSRPVSPDRLRLGLAPCGRVSHPCPLPLCLTATNRGIH